VQGSRNLEIADKYHPAVPKEYFPIEKHDLNDDQYMKSLKDCLLPGGYCPYVFATEDSSYPFDPLDYEDLIQPQFTY